MILPHIDRIRLEQTKVTDYLLNSAHPDNGGKAAFFTGWGFTTADWTSFAEAILGMAAGSKVVDRVQSKWGLKYVVDGPLNAPNGTTPPVRTVWVVDVNSDVPRLITAYPGK